MGAKVKVSVRVVVGSRCITEKAARKCSSAAGNTKLTENLERVLVQCQGCDLTPHVIPFTCVAAQCTMCGMVCMMLGSRPGVYSSLQT